MQHQNKSHTIVEESQLLKQLQEVMEHPQLEKLIGDRVEASNHAETFNTGNFKPSG